MDKIDKEILMHLQRDAKLNTKEISSLIGLSVTPTYERIKKLEQSKIIKLYVALLDKTKIDRKVIAYCQITLAKHQKELINNFKDEVLLLSEIMECHHVSGNFDFLLKVSARDIDEFYEFINEKLSLVGGILTIQSSFVMDSVKDSTAYELDSFIKKK
ncbi:MULTISPECIES: Lrp/AsnC family transcriptional regulator [unclassified Polaribacter]|uniref:Lrp/AsnC family transcriptional regulator n=1 Tax=unclassified Polaribacter TaxID=196858 RepID=UPI00140D30F3|nr:MULTISPECIES: Lrp/AsnC family transcriptional regulator [unclassified Polaribacter]